MEGILFIIVIFILFGVIPILSNTYWNFPNLLDTFSNHQKKDNRLVGMSKKVSPKSRVTALLLCFFWGFFGGHRFYVKKIGTGLLMFFTLSGFGIWFLVDFIMIIVGVFKDKNRLPLRNWLISRDVTQASIITGVMGLYCFSIASIIYETIDTDFAFTSIIYETIDTDFAFNIITALTSDERQLKLPLNDN